MESPRSFIVFQKKYIYGGGDGKEGGEGREEAVGIGCCCDHSFLVNKKGELWTWDSSFGTLGHGNNSDSNEGGGDESEVAQAQEPMAVGGGGGVVAFGEGGWGFTILEDAS
jgi:hypothetical protein